MRFVVQGTLPAVDRHTGGDPPGGPRPRGPVPRRPRRAAVGPPHLRSAGRDAAAGVQTIFTFQVDNPLVRVGRPELLGHHRLAGADMTSVVVRKVGPDEKMGVIARVDGRTAVVEYSDLPDELAAGAGRRRRARLLGRLDRRPLHRGAFATAPHRGRAAAALPPGGEARPVPGRRWPAGGAGRAQRRQVRDVPVRRAAGGRAHDDGGGRARGRVLADQERRGRRLPRDGAPRPERALRPLARGGRRRRAARRRGPARGPRDRPAPGARRATNWPPRSRPASRSTAPRSSTDGARRDGPRARCGPLGGGRRTRPRRSAPPRPSGRSRPPPGAAATSCTSTSGADAPAVRATCRLPASQAGSSSLVVVEQVGVGSRPACATSTMRFELEELREPDHQDQVGARLRRPRARRPAGSGWRNRCRSTSGSRAREAPPEDGDDLGRVIDRQRRLGGQGDVRGVGRPRRSRPRRRSPPRSPTRGPPHGSRSPRRGRGVRPAARSRPGRRSGGPRRAPWRPAGRWRRSRAGCARCRPGAPRARRRGRTG